MDVMPTRCTNHSSLSAAGTHGLLDPLLGQAEERLDNCARAIVGLSGPALSILVVLALSGCTPSSETGSASSGTFNSAYPSPVVTQSQSQAIPPRQKTGGDPLHSGLDETGAAPRANATPRAVGATPPQEIFGLSGIGGSGAASVSPTPCVSPTAWRTPCPSPTASR